tara:strand:- start:750 stop:941 length:192 start_codon:yes stop_codon:yes gene_type:complete
LRQRFTHDPMAERYVFWTLSPTRPPEAVIDIKQQGLQRPFEHFSNTMILDVPAVSFAWLFFQK